MKRIISGLLCAALMLMLLPVISKTASAESLNNFNIRIDEPVASYTPDFFPMFNTGTTVYFTVTWQENSPGFNKKLNSSDEFRAGLAYKVEIWIRLSDGNYFPVDGYGDLATAITVNGKAISSLKIRDRDSQNRITEVTITCEYDPLPGSTISSVLVKGIPTPVAGNMPIYSFTIDSSAYSFYHTAPVVWWDMNTGKELDSSDTFIQGHKYQVNIWLQANREGGFTFKTDSNGNAQVNATLNSWAADSVTTAYEQDGREVIDIRYTFAPCAAAHTCAPTPVPQQDPTCLLSGFKAYYECSCGKYFEDAAGQKEITDMDGYGIIPAKGHKEGDWTYSGTQHFKKCTTCNEVIPGTEEDHKWSPKPHIADAKGHAYQCADCKACDKQQPHTPGPEATETAPQTCTQCDYIITPAKNHTHKLTLVPAAEPTCVDAGTVAHYACTDCSMLFSDAEGKNQLPADTNVTIPPLGHTTSDKWAYDMEYHWHTCTACGEMLNETQMLHDAQEGKCPTCGYTIGEEIVPAETKPVSADTDKQDKAPSDSKLLIIAVAVGVLCFGAGIGAAVLIIKKKKS